VAIIQGAYFETPSREVTQVNEFDVKNPGHSIDSERFSINDRVRLGVDADMDIPEGVMGPALLQLRRLFSDNQTAAHEHNRRSGRVDKRVLGQRAWNDDSRLFTKKRLPAKKDYAVLIGIDLSSSTFGDNIVLAKRAAFAQAELCQRLGVKFAVYAHNCTAERNLSGDAEFAMDIYKIKSFDNPWDDAAKRVIASLCPHGGNLDGHTMEYYRRRLDEVEATDKILLYYTDGKMPAANHDEELEVLQREIKTCRQRRYTLLGVGIRTDSPVRHGLDTVEVHEDEDLKKVVEHLGKRLGAATR